MKQILETTPANPAKVDAYMPLWIGDYLADTARLTTEQHGAYLLLIMDYWRNGALPDDPVALAQIARMPRAEWMRHRRALLVYFEKREGRLYHKRIERELARSRRQRQTAAEKGRKGALARWKQDNAPAMPRPAPGHKPSSPSPASVQNKTSAASGDLVFPLPEGVQAETWAAFVDMRRSKRNPLTAYSAKLVTRKLAALAHMGHDPQALLETAIERGWTSVFPPDAPNGPRRTAHGPGAAWWASEQGIIAKGRELELSPRPGEAMQEFKARVSARVETLERGGRT